MLKRIIIPLIILGLAVAFFKVMLASKDKPEEIVVNEHVWRVKQITVKKQTLSPAMTLYGRIESPSLLNAAAPASSQIVQVLVKEGQRVEKGQLMLALDKNDFEPLVRQAQAKVNELKAQIKSEQLRHQLNINSLKNEKKLLLLSSKALARAVKVKSKNLGSVSETEQAMQQVELRRLSLNQMQFSVQEHDARQEQFEARLMQAQAELTKAHLALSRSQVFAPFTGVVAKVNVAQGDRVNSNEKLLSFYSIEHLEIRAKLPAKQLLEVQSSLVKGDYLKGVASSGEQSIPLKLERLSGEAQASGVDAIFSIETDKIPFRIGAIVVIQLQRAAQKNMIKVPYQVMYGTERLYQIKEQRLQVIKVTTIGEHYAVLNKNNSAQDAQLLIASDTLNDGDQVLATHLPNAFTGLKVEVIQ